MFSLLIKERLWTHRRETRRPMMCLSSRILPKALSRAGKPIMPFVVAREAPDLRSLLLACLKHQGDLLIEGRKENGREGCIPGRCRV